MSLLRRHWWEKGKQAKGKEHPGRNSRIAKKVNVARTGRVSQCMVGRWVYQENPHPQKGKYPQQDVEEWRAGGQAAVRQERWQYVGIAGSQLNSYASILPPLQFQVTEAIQGLGGVLFSKISSSTWGGKTHSLIENASFFPNTVFLRVSEFEDS